MDDVKKNLFCKNLLASAIELVIATGISYCAVTWLLKKLDPMKDGSKKLVRKKAQNQLERIGKNRVMLTDYETAIASYLIVPSDIDISWNDIAGLDDILKEITETVIFPIKKSQLLAGSKLARPPKGVLLHGPPGCGKTLIAKATAREADAAFINLDIAMLTDKWYGESQKHVSALFSLAEKLQPCIIFIDEIDSLLRTRSSQDHEATAMMKAQFMFLWDGLITDTEKTVIIMGATNRPQDVDSAILRRLPATFKIHLPNQSQRKAILKLIMEKESTELIDYDSLAKLTEGFSGSDLQELCRMGALVRVRELVGRHDLKQDSDYIKLRSITMDDIMVALIKMNAKEEICHQI